MAVELLFWIATKVAEEFDWNYSSLKQRLCHRKIINEFMKLVVWGHCDLGPESKFLVKMVSFWCQLDVSLLYSEKDESF